MFIPDSLHLDNYPYIKHSRTLHLGRKPLCSIAGDIKNMRKCFNTICMEDKYLEYLF
jgi:hypothetical protein